MSLPEFTQYVNPLIAALRKLGGAARPKAAYQTIERDLSVPRDVLEERHNSGAPKFENQIAWARWYLVASGFIDGSHRGVWKLTDKGWATEFLNDAALRDIVAITQEKSKGTITDAGEEVSESEIDELNVEMLKALYQSDATARAFLEHCASRQRNQSETNVDRALQILRYDGNEVTRQQVISAFRELQECGCGQFVTGRRGWPSRLVWSTAMISVGRTASGEQDEIEQFEEDAEKDVNDHNWLTHSFHLRPEITLEFELPSDLTAGDAQRLARFIEALPFDGD